MSAETFWVRAWYTKKTWLLFLAPIAWLFSGLSSLRRHYLQTVYQGTPFSAPVVVIGNISVGGSGKTPLIIALVRELKEKGYSVGVVSRGYGGKAIRYPLIVSKNTPASESGDEPLLIVKSCGCPVVVDPNRENAVRTLLERFSCDLVLSDDGLQHYQMHRDVEVAVIDASRGLGNKLTLPAGPLREPLKRLQEVDFIVHNGVEHINADSGNAKNTCFVKLEPVGLRKFGAEELISAAQWVDSMSVHAVAGIGHPERFASTLKEMGFEPDLHAKNDHEALSIGDLRFKDQRPIIITEKDAVKYNDAVPENLWVLEVRMRLSDQLVDNVLACAGLPVTNL